MSGPTLIPSSAALPSPAAYSQAELELIDVHRAMNPWARQKLARMAHAYADTWPAPKRRTHLQLVAASGLVASQ